MTTTTQSPPRAKASPVKGVSRLTLSIDGSDYALRPIARDASQEGFVKGWRLKNLDSDRVYQVMHTDGSAVDTPPLSCDCPDFTYRKCGEGGRCKHLRALVAWGLLDAPAVPPHEVRRLPGRPCSNPLAIAPEPGTVDLALSDFFANRPWVVMELERAAASGRRARLSDDATGRVILEGRPGARFAWRATLLGIDFGRAVLAADAAVNGQGYVIEPPAAPMKGGA